MNENDLTILLTRMGSSKFRMVPGPNLMCSCPLARWRHAEGTDSKNSFSMQPYGNNLCKCWACGFTGGLRNLVKEYQGLTGHNLGVFEDESKLSFEERFKRRKVDFSIVKSLDIRADQFFKARQSKVFDIEKYRFAIDTFPQYAFDRGVTEEQINKWQIGYFSSTRMLFIPTFDRTNKFVGYTTRPAFEDFTEEKYKHAGGFKKELYLYGEQFVDLEVPVAFVSEGFFDVWSMERAGLVNCYANMGTSCSKEQAKFLKQFKIVIVFPHNDKPNKDGKFPGMMTAESFQTELTPLGVHVILAPFVSGKKDVGDWTKEEIRTVVSEIIEQV